MDEKRSDSSPLNDADHERTDTTATSGTLDAPTPDEPSEGDWSFVTQAHYDPAEPPDLTTVIINAIADAEDIPAVEVKTPPSTRSWTLRVSNPCYSATLTFPGTGQPQMSSFATTSIR